MEACATSGLPYEGDVGQQGLPNRCELMRTGDYREREPLLDYDDRSDHNHADRNNQRMLHESRNTLPLSSRTSAASALSVLTTPPRVRASV